MLIGPFLEFHPHTQFMHARGAWAETATHPRHGRAGWRAGLAEAARSAATTVALAAAHVFLCGHFPHTLYAHNGWARFPVWYKCACIYLIPLQVCDPPGLLTPEISARIETSPNKQVSAVRAYAPPYGFGCASLTDPLLPPPVRRRGSSTTSRGASR